MERPQVGQEGIGVVALPGESLEAPNDTIEPWMNDFTFTDNHHSITSPSHVVGPALSESLDSTGTPDVGTATALPCEVDRSLRNGSRTQRYCAHWQRV